MTDSPTGALIERDSFEREMAGTLNLVRDGEDYQNATTAFVWAGWNRRAALASRSTEPGGEATGEPMRMDALAIYAAACDVRDWANALGTVLENKHALIASVERLRAMVVEESIRVAQPTRSELIEECCARIKAADDNTSEHGYMLDSNDCISVLRGTWKAWS